MQFKDYQAAAMAYVNEPDSAANADGAALGLISEAGELAGAVRKVLYQGHPHDPCKIREEAGDLLWSLALGSHATGQALALLLEKNDPAEFVSRPTGNPIKCCRTIARSASTLADGLFNGGLCSANARVLVQALASLLSLHGFTLADAMAYNVNVKLPARFPSGRFTVADSIARTDATA